MDQLNKVLNSSQEVRDELNRKFKDFDYDDFLENCFRANGKSFNYTGSDVKEHLVNGMKSMINAYFGVRPGIFISAVIDNNLVGAVENADHINRNFLFVYCSFKYNYLPITS